MWLINASVEVRQQLARFGPWPDILRQAPIQGVLLTDGELDHVLGLLELRQRSPWTLWAPEGVLQALEALGLLSGLTTYAPIEVRPTPVGVEVPLGGIKAQWVLLGERSPAYATRGGGTYALLLEEGGRRVLVAPAVPHLGLLEACLQGVDLALLDGTFFRAQEPLEVGLGLDALAMGHVPVEVLAPRLALLPGRKVLVHLNNTNPLVDPSAPERVWLLQLGVEVAEDGMVLEV